MNNHIVFYCLYNPITKEILTDDNDNVVEVESNSEGKDGYIPYPVTDITQPNALRYDEHFCHCDECDKLCLQDDLSFTYDGVPLCYDCWIKFKPYE